MLTLQKFLLDNYGDRLKLSSEYGIFSKVHCDYPDLYQFTYDQISCSKIKDHPMVRESRGIILDRANDWRVISRPFDRFFNWGEIVLEDTFDWSSFVAQEKIDGSLMILYHYAGKWNVATKGSPAANGTVGDNPFTFADLFWEIFHKEAYSTTTNLDPRATYLFELTSKYNRIVTTQLNNDGKLTLIGVRDTQTGIEFPVDLYRDGFDVVRSFPMTTIEEILLAAKELSPSQQEGFVLVDKNFNRIKVKSEKYVLIHHLKSGNIRRSLLDLWKSGESEELLSYHTEFQNEFDDLDASIHLLCQEIDNGWSMTKHIIDRKEFALTVNQYYKHISSALFMKKDNKLKNTIDYFKIMDIKKLETMLDFII